MELHTHASALAGGRDNEPDAAAPVWPVLAHVPHVGPGGARSDAPLAPARDQPRVGRPDVAVAPPYMPPAAGLPSGDAPAPAHRRSRIDAAAGPPRRAATRRRIDRADRDLRPGTRVRRSEPSPSLAHRAYLLHAALTPHWGLAGVAVLAVAAALLYGLTRPEPIPVQASEMIVLDDDRLDAALPAAPAVDQGAGDVLSQHLPLGMPSPPRVATVASPADGDRPAAQRTAEVADAIDCVEPAPHSDNGPAIGPAADDGASTRDDGRDDITPTAHTHPYPVTSYPVFYFDAPAGAAAPRGDAGALPPR